MSLALRPARLQAKIAADLVRAAALKVSLDQLADSLDESRYPTVPFSNPAWDVDSDRWATTPDDITDLDAALARDWPGGAS